MTSRRYKEAHNQPHKTLLLFGFSFCSKHHHINRWNKLIVWFCISMECCFSGLEHCIYSFFLKIFSYNIFIQVKVEVYFLINLMFMNWIVYFKERGFKNSFKQKEGGYFIGVMSRSLESNWMKKTITLLLLLVLITDFGSQISYFKNFENFWNSK